VVDISRKDDDMLGPLYTSSGSRLSSLLHLGVRNRRSELTGYQTESQRETLLKVRTS
jgi:cation transporter-like permease